MTISASAYMNMAPNQIRVSKSPSSSLAARRKDGAAPVVSSTSTTTEINQSNIYRNRREFFAVVSAIGIPFINPKPADALQKKNESLCGTGFFDHFQEYRCTNVGDISDEGISKDLNGGEMGLTDSLMGKLGVSMDDFSNEGAGGDKGSTSKADDDPKRSSHDEKEQK